MQRDEAEPENHSLLLLQLTLKFAKVPAYRIEIS